MEEKEVIEILRSLSDRISKIEEYLQNHTHSTDGKACLPLDQVGSDDYLDVLDSLYEDDVENDKVEDQGEKK